MRESLRVVASLRDSFVVCDSVLIDTFWSYSSLQKAPAFQASKRLRGSDSSFMVAHLVFVPGWYVKSARFPKLSNFVEFGVGCFWNVVPDRKDRLRSPLNFVYC